MWKRWWPIFIKNRKRETIALSSYQTLWHTWESEVPGCARGFMWFSEALKPPGTLEEWNPWVCQRLYRLLWILETLWYTRENETPERIRGFIVVLWIFENLRYTLRKKGPYVYQIIIVFAWFFVEGRTSEEGRAKNKNITFCSFWSVFLLLRLTKLRGSRVAKGSWVPGSVCGSLWWSDSRRGGCHEFCSFWSFRGGTDFWGRPGQK